MNKNPYEVLGIPSNASDDEVKRAYRDLTRKYHPDANVNNPLADLAEEKFKEVQEAYDTIMTFQVKKCDINLLKFRERLFEKNWQQKETAWPKKRTSFLWIFLYFLKMIIRIGSIRFGWWRCHLKCKADA